MDNDINKTVNKKNTLNYFCNHNTFDYFTIFVVKTNELT